MEWSGRGAAGVSGDECPQGGHLRVSSQPGQKACSLSFPSPRLQGTTPLQLHPAPVSSVPRALEIRPFGSRPSQASPPWDVHQNHRSPNPPSAGYPFQPAPTAMPNPSAFQGLKHRVGLRKCLWTRWVNAY